MLGPQSTTCLHAWQLRQPLTNGAAELRAGRRRPVAILRQLDAAREQPLVPERKVGAKQCRETLQHHDRAGGEHERGRDLDARKPPGGGRPPRHLRVPPASVASRTLMRIARHTGASPNSSPHVTAVIAVTASTRMSIVTRLTSAAAMPLSGSRSGVSQTAASSPAAAPSQTARGSPPAVAEPAGRVKRQRPGASPSRASAPSSAPSAGWPRSRSRSAARTPSRRAAARAAAAHRRRTTRPAAPRAASNDVLVCG